MANIIDIQRMSTEDGPGMRTTVFFKGCSLACEWCHNPESISFQPQVQWLKSRCIGCGRCVPACPNQGIFRDDAGLHIQRNKCVGCFTCVNACPTGAMEGKGENVSVEDLFTELIKDQAYFGPDGGVTLSGGEALLQEDSVELLKLLKRAGIQTALDSCGMVLPQRLLQALRYTDVLLYDLKLADSDAHKRYTGKSNETVLKNLKLAADWALDGGRLWIRTPVIPGATDSDGNIADIADIVDRIPKVERWELCCFNNLCRDKYKRLDLVWPYDNTNLIKREKMEHLLDIATQHCKNTMIQYTGAVLRREE